MNFNKTNSEEKVKIRIWIRTSKSDPDKSRTHRKSVRSDK